jgi:nucleoside-diphosphate-sugar epimerase
MLLFNGASGSLGAYLASALAAADVPGRALHARLERPDQLREELQRLRAEGPFPARIVFAHLAAKVSVPECERDPLAAEAINVAAAARAVREVCEFVRGEGSEVRVVYVSSGHVYAATEPGVLLDEDAAVAPRSVYARTKLAGEKAVTEAAHSFGGPCLVARVFGLMAPQQPPNYLLPGLSRRVREAELGAIPGLSFSRDYLDARDVCEVLVELARREIFVDGVLNVCSGKPTALRQVLELLLRELRPAEADTLLNGAVEAPARADDIPWIVGDPTRLRQLLGRDPQRIPLLRTVREHLAAASAASNRV